MGQVATGGRFSRTVLSDEVYAALRERLMDGEIPPDSRLNIDRLSADMGVSPTPVREALARLEADELVRKEPRRGYLSTPLPSPEQLMDIFDFRDVIEPVAAERAAQRVDPEAATLLDAEMAAGLEAQTGPSFADHQASFQHDQRLHQLIANLSGSAQLATAFARSHAHLHTFRLQERFDESVWRRTLTEHRAIVDRIKSGDHTGARATMAAHLASSRDHARAMMLVRSQAS